MRGLKTWKRYQPGEAQAIAQDHAAGISIEALSARYGRTRMAIHQILFKLRGGAINPRIHGQGRLTRRRTEESPPSGADVLLGEVTRLPRDKVPATLCPRCGGPLRASGLLASCLMCGRTIPLVDGSWDEERSLLQRGTD